VSERVEFAGEHFEVAEKIGLMPLMRFAKVAKAGVDSDSQAGLVAMYDLLEQCIAPQDWPRFEAHADKVRADGEQLMKVVSDVLEVVTQRPTQRPSASSDGPQTVSESSAANSSDAVIRRLEEKGRPDLALVVLETQEWQARQSHASA
jgi:hypothetical protein